MNIPYVQLFLLVMIGIFFNSNDCLCSKIEPEPGMYPSSDSEEELLLPLSPGTQNLVEAAKAFFRENAEVINSTREGSRQLVEESLDSSVAAGERITDGIVAGTETVLQTGYDLPQNTVTVGMDNVLRSVLHTREVLNNPQFNPTSLADQGALTNLGLASVTAYQANQAVNKIKMERIKNKKARVVLTGLQCLGQAGVCAHLWETCCCCFGSNRGKVESMIIEAKKNREV